MDKTLQNQIISLLAPYHPSRIGIFGSFARGENKKDSDLDILISFKERMGLIKLVQIQQQLEDQLGISVDLVTFNSLKNSRLKAHIHQDLITIFDEEG